MEDIVPIIAIVTSMVTIFVALPWIVFHYISKWKAQATLTKEDEDLLDELHELARRLDDRMRSIERIIQADNPGWRGLGQDPVEDLLEDRTERLEEAAERLGKRPARPRRNA
jgi:phage shock protein B